MKKHKIYFGLVFVRKIGWRIPRGIDFGSPDACECFQYAADAGSTDILKNRKTGSSYFAGEAVFAKIMLVLCQNDKPRRRK